MSCGKTWSSLKWSRKRSGPSRCLPLLSQNKNSPLRHKEHKDIGARDEPSESVLVPFFLVSFVPLWWILLRPNLLSDDHAHEPGGGAARQDLGSDRLGANGFLRSLQSSVRRPGAHRRGRSNSE